MHVEDAAAGNDLDVGRVGLHEGGKAPRPAGGDAHHPEGFPRCQPGDHGEAGAAHLSIKLIPVGTRAAPSFPMADLRVGEISGTCPEASGATAIADRAMAPPWTRSTRSSLAATCPGLRRRPMETRGTARQYPDRDRTLRPPSRAPAAAPRTAAPRVPPARRCRVRLPHRCRRGCRGRREQFPVSACRGDDERGLDLGHVLRRCRPGRR